MPATGARRHVPVLASDAPWHCTLSSSGPPRALKSLPNPASSDGDANGIDRFDCAGRPQMRFAATLSARREFGIVAGRKGIREMGTRRPAHALLSSRRDADTASDRKIRMFPARSAAQRLQSANRIDPQITAVGALEYPGVWLADNPVFRGTAPTVTGAPPDDLDGT